MRAGGSAVVILSGCLRGTHTKGSSHKPQCLDNESTCCTGGCCFVIVLPSRTKSQVDMCLRHNMTASCPHPHLLRITPWYRPTHSGSVPHDGSSVTPSSTVNVRLEVAFRAAKGTAGAKRTAAAALEAGVAPLYTSTDVWERPAVGPAKHTTRKGPLRKERCMQETKSGRNSSTSCHQRLR
jgi:hypothetical protein